MLILPHRKITRAKIIREYMQRAGYAAAVCFTCGNAGRALIDVGVETLVVGPGGALLPEKWWSQADISRAWPHLFDATSGHLPMEVMLQLAEEYRQRYRQVLKNGGSYVVPSGSGETAVALALAYPRAHIVARYDNTRPECKYEPGAPLNKLVGLLCSVEI